MAGGGLATGVDRDDDALAPEALRRLADHGRPLERRRVQRDLVGARAEQEPDVVDRADPAADGQRHVDALRRPAHDVEHDRAVFVGRRDVEEDELVGALRVVCEGRLDGVTRVAQVHEAHALDDAAVLDVEARDDPFRQHYAPASSLSAWARSIAPV